MPSVNRIWASEEKILHFIRHGLAEHNAALEEQALTGAEVFDLYASTIADARLVPRGRMQADLLGEVLETLPDDEQPELVASSPLTRALDTARIAAPADTPLACVEVLREHNGLWPCDQRRPLDTLRWEFPDVAFDGLTEQDELWTKTREGAGAARTRATRALEWLWARPETVIAAVSHGSFLQQSLFSPAVVSVDDEHLHLPWTNCELRTVVLSRGTDTPFRAQLRRVVVPVASCDRSTDIERHTVNAHNIAELNAFCAKLGAAEVERRLRVTSLPWYQDQRVSKL